MSRKGLLAPHQVLLGLLVIKSKNPALSGISAAVLRTTTTITEKEQPTLSSNKDPGLIPKEMSVASSSVSAIPFNVRC